MKRRTGPWWVTDVLVPLTIVLLFVGAMGLAGWLAPA